MRLLVIMIGLCLVACNQDDSRNNDSPLPAKPPLPADTAATDSIPKTGNFNYNQYIPAELTAFLDKELPGWSLPAVSRWEEYWFTQYKKDSSLVNYTSGDFNCDGKKDYAIILQEKNSHIVTYAIISKTDGFTKDKIEDHGTETLWIGVGLELIQPSTIHHLGDGDKEPPPVKLKCPAIQLVWFEKAARTYYWENGKRKMIQTGD